MTATYSREAFDATDARIAADAPRMAGRPHVIVRVEKLRQLRAALLEQAHADANREYGERDAALQDQQIAAQRRGVSLARYYLAADGRVTAAAAANTRHAAVVEARDLAAATGHRCLVVGARSRAHAAGKVARYHRGDLSPSELIDLAVA